MPIIPGLRLVLTICGVVEVVLPYICSQHYSISKLALGNFLTKAQLTIDLKQRQSRFVLRRAKHKIVNRVAPPKSRLLELPSEVRLQIWQWVCTPQADGKITGAQYLLLINKQIYEEANPFFDGIEHTIRIGDLQRYKNVSVEFMGLPRIITTNESLDWHMASLKHLVLDVKICSIGTMTPDCFDIYISHNGKEQWRNLKRLIGIWPMARDIPLESIRLNLSKSDYDAKSKTYRCDLVRVIRNFKRTRVWAETGDCSVRKGNRSVLLPLVRAFNEGRRNWDRESTVDNNLIVRYDKHMLSKKSINIDIKDKSEEEIAEMIEEQRLKWSVQPTDDTSRSDNSVWPEWTGKEEKYIHDKMIRRQREDDRDFECLECLAVFDKPKELRAHVARGRLKE